MPIEPIKLTFEDQKVLEDMAPDITALENELARAIDAGFDVTELRKKLDATKTLREGILRVYGR